LISTSSHPDVALRTLRNFIEIDGDDTPEIHAAAKKLLSAALREPGDSLARFFPDRSAI